MNSEKYYSKTESEVKDIKLIDIYYNCSECPSNIEILSINEDKGAIEFKCLNKHNKIMTIRQYLEKMNYYRNNKINEDICNIHNGNKYISYCFNCNLQLCKECLITKNHINHFKNNIYEIQPDNKELDIIKQLIEDYKIKINKLKNEKLSKNNELENYKKKERIRYQEKIKLNNNNNKEKELKIIKDKYNSDIKEIQKIYSEKVKLIKNNYQNNNKNIDNKYKIINEKDNIYYRTIIDELNKKYEKNNININYDIKIENLINNLKINEIIYNTYINYKNNYYNCKNINNIIFNYEQKKNARNNKS